jgi:hypothetical protein
MQLFPHKCWPAGHSHSLLELHVNGLTQEYPSEQQDSLVGMHPLPQAFLPGHVSVEPPSFPPPPPATMIDGAPNIINANSAKPLMIFCYFLVYPPMPPRMDPQNRAAATNSKIAFAGDTEFHVV